MKKNMLITCATLAALGLSAFSFLPQLQNHTKCEPEKKTPILVQYKPVEFNYDINNRFQKTITKSQMENAKTIYDLFSAKEIEGLESFKNVRITVMSPDKTQTENERTEFGKTETFTAEQISLLHALDYSTNFYVEAVCPNNHAENYHFVYYMTVVPEKEAKYSAGNQALIDYLKMNSMIEIAGVDERKLWFGRVNFIISAEGEISAAHLESTSGYTLVDEKMLALITNLPGTWEPATNEKGEKIAQQLVFSFGKPGGC